MLLCAEEEGFQLQYVRNRPVTLDKLSFYVWPCFGMSGSWSSRASRGQAYI